MISKLSHVLLNTLAWLLLERRFLSHRWRIKPDALARLQPCLLDLYATYERGRVFFNEVDICRTCSSTCCAGAYNRFTVYDHVSDRIGCYPDTLKWGYRLRPFGSYRLNRVDKGFCPLYVAGRGCSVEYRRRPSVCIWWICRDMKARFTPEQKHLVTDLRKKIDRVFWMYAYVLLSGGMERTANNHPAAIPAEDST